MGHSITGELGRKFQSVVDDLGLGVICLDEDHQVIRYNQAAGQVLRRQDGICTDDGRLVAYRPEDTRALQRALDAAVTRTSDAIVGAPLQLPRRCGCHVYDLLIYPVSAQVAAAFPYAVVVFVARPETLH